MRYSSRENYHIFHWPDRPDLFITDIWNKYPGIIIDRYLVNTSFDSGFLELTPEEKQHGWFKIGELAHSPLIESTTQVPHDQYDEWLVFDAPVQIQHFKTFVNYGGFNPIDFEGAEILFLFWEQMLRVQPLHVIGENDSLYVVTRDYHLAETIKKTEAKTVK